MRLTHARAVLLTAVVLGGMGGLVVPAVASAHSDAHTLTFISQTVRVAGLAMPYSGRQETDVNSKGKVIGFDEVYFKEFGALSGAGDVAFDVTGGLLYGKIATTNALRGYSGTVTGGTGAFKGATGTIKTKVLSKAGTKQAVTITYST